MISSNRDILVLFGNKEVESSELDHHLRSLHSILEQVETPEVFCRVHELVDRDRITRKPKKILKETKYYRLRPFRFLINKN
jgi:hypothetical protein